MKHYKSIMRIHNVISDLQVEIEKLESIDKNQIGYAGYVFVEEDKKNINDEILELTETMKLLINLSK